MVLGSAPAVTTAVAIVVAATVVVAAAVTAAAATTAAGITADAAAVAAGTRPTAEQDDQDQNDPQTIVATPAVVTTHKSEPPMRDGDRLAISVHLMRQVPECAYSGRFPRMVSTGLQQRSSISDRVAAGIFSAPPQSAQKISTEL